MTNTVNQAFYENFPEEISIREDRIKLWWKDALDFTFGDLCLKDKTILEIGAGKGILCDYLRDSPQLIVYTDISANRLRMNRYESLLPGRTKGVLSDMNSPCFDPAQFDLILFVNCLMFSDDKIRMIDIYRPMLKPGGSIVIFEPLCGNPLYILRHMFASDYNRLQLRNMKYSELEAICQRHVPVKKRYFYLSSIATVPLFLKFPGNRIVNSLHGILKRIDASLLRIPLLRRWAVIACAIIRPDN